MKRNTLLSLSLFVLIPLAAACDTGDAPGASTPSPTPTAAAPAPGTGGTGGTGNGGSTAPPSPTPHSDPAMVPTPAPIDSVDVAIGESAPPQYFLHVVSGLSSGCATFYRNDVERAGDEITVTVLNFMPGPDDTRACTMIYGMMEHNIPLGSDFTSGQTYTVHVNDVTTTFTAQ